jgi:hypothetical protein
VTILARQARLDAAERERLAGGRGAGAHEVVHHPVARPVELGRLRPVFLVHLGLGQGIPLRGGTQVQALGVVDVGGDRATLHHRRDDLAVALIAQPGEPVRRSVRNRRHGQSSQHKPDCGEDCEATADAEARERMEHSCHDRPLLSLSGFTAVGVGFDAHRACGRASQQRGNPVCLPSAFCGAVRTALGDRPAN